MSRLFNSLGGDDYGAVLNVICWVKPSSAAPRWIYIDCLAMIGNLLAMTEQQQQGQRERTGRERKSPANQSRHRFFVTPGMHRGVVDNPGSLLTK